MAIKTDGFSIETGNGRITGKTIEDWEKSYSSGKMPEGAQTRQAPRRTPSPHRRRCGRIFQRKRAFYRQSTRSTRRLGYFSYVHFYHYG